MKRQVVVRSEKEWVTATVKLSVGEWAILVTLLEEDRGSREQDWEAEAASVSRKLGRVRWRDNTPHRSWDEINAELSKPLPQGVVDLLGCRR